eukprot:tig00000248_g21782.t1
MAPKPSPQLPPALPLEALRSHPAVRSHPVTCPGGALEEAACGAAAGLVERGRRALRRLDCHVARVRAALFVPRAADGLPAVADAAAGYPFAELEVVG